MQPDKYFLDVLGASYIIEGNYSAILNQTNIKTNTNKFYIVQLFKNPAIIGWRLGKRYGRVGERGDVSFDHFTSSFAAISAFKKLFRSKTGNSWGEEFVPKAGKYTLLIPDSDEVEDVPLDKVDTASAVSQLEERLQSFLKLIANKDMMNAHISKMNFDTQKLPLGKITKKQLSDANAILKELAEFLRKDVLENLKAAGMAASEAQEFIDSNVADLSSKYWTIIPYATKRSRPPPLIDTLKYVESQSENLEVLYNIGVFGRMKADNDLIDTVYDAMHITLEALDENDAMRKMVAKYVVNTHGHSHGYGLEIKNVYSASKERGETEDDIFNSTTNHVLLFHGSRMPNFVGILTEGLRIPQATQVSNGSVLGMGIYFANCVTKSFNYCGTCGICETGVMLVCEVALGTSQTVTQATFDTRPPAQFDSRTALGKNTPVVQAGKTTTIEENEVLVPYGKIDVSTQPSSSFMYDEFVIFNTAQYRIRWVVELMTVPVKGV